MSQRCKQTSQDSLSVKKENKNRRQLKVFKFQYDSSWYTRITSGVTHKDSIVGKTTWCKTISLI